MAEVPRGAFTASQIAERAGFFSFGTNKCEGRGNSLRPID